MLSQYNSNKDLETQSRSKAKATTMTMIFAMNKVIRVTSTHKNNNRYSTAKRQERRIEKRVAIMRPILRNNRRKTNKLRRGSIKSNLKLSRIREKRNHKK